MFFSGNIRRKTKKVQGNFVFRRKKAKVTRLEVRHRMELNPETDATRRQKRLRTAGAGVKVAAGLLFVMGLFSAGVIVVKQAFMENERFQLKHISVVTDGAAGLSAGQIVEASGLHEGVNMLSVSLVRVKEQLTALPQVKSAKVTRGYPGIVFLEVMQRTPVAWLECKGKNVDAKVAGRGCLLDAEGFVVPSGELSDEQRALPVIEVADVGRLIPGQGIDSPDVLAALNFIQQHHVTGLSHLIRLKRVDASRAYAFKAVFENQVTAVFPRHDLQDQMQRMARIVELSEEKDWNLASVNLLVQLNVPVTFHDGSVVNDPLHKPALRRETLARSN
ncbi:FtsQ-type POTRA domain-containing protein [Phragmitibacter flavus]|uniref:FtsQ-type POTRA domain-containing protein n=1 Tax=Phragmitibacter flavus TaxID=2576071 RepID=A0A5R8K7U1_9BACT|nr:FtsQ-type POTRA domain-containing protein [Phragmitibacter flavus]TLD68408.1 FtsQ-type POTRA domain-containing protein [Phragmitibacter flavus]